MKTPIIRAVSIETLPPKSMRYRTVGDWFFTAPGVLTIQVADTGNWIHNILVAIHELIEACQCVHKGISQKRVDNFDLAHEDDEDPGSHPKAPYHDQHMIAMSVEMMLSVMFGIKWRPYEDSLNKTFYLTPRRKTMGGGKKMKGKSNKAFSKLKLGKMGKKESKAVKEK